MGVPAMRAVLAAGLLALASALWQEQSLFTTMPSDPRAIDANDPRFGLVPDGQYDCTQGLLAALNATYADGRPNATMAGSRIVFLRGPGLYRISSTIDLRIWQRLIGWGEERPTLLLAASTSGFSNVSNPTPMLRANWFAPGAYTPSNSTDGGNIAFGIGVLNVNFQIDAGNPGAVALRWRVAQGGVLRAVSMQLASDTLAGIHCPGWGLSEIVIRGGRYGILIHSTGAWPSSYRDLVITNQTEACVATSEYFPSWEGSVFTRTLFANASVAFTSLASGSPGPGPIDAQSGTRAIFRHCQFTGITRALVSLSNATQEGASFTMLESSADGPSLVLELTEPAIANQSVFAPAPGPYRVRMVHVGVDVLQLQLPSPQAQFEVIGNITATAELDPLPPTDIPALPYPVTSWVNAADAGVVGDGKTDVTAALQAVLSRGGSVYLPTGVYLISDTVFLPANTTLFGLHCFDVTLRLADLAPGYQDPSQPKPVLVVEGSYTAPAGSRPLLRVAGMNFQTASSFGPQPAPVPAGFWNPNPGAISLLWHANGIIPAAPGQLLPMPSQGLTDVFVHPATFPDNPRLGNGSNTEISIYIEGGNAVMADVWSCNSYSDGGMRVFNSAGPGVFYQLSDEHHNQHEVWFSNVTDWQVWTIQTEDRASDSQLTVPVLCESCTGVVVGGLYTNRGGGCPPAPAVVVDEASYAFALLHSYGFPWQGRQIWNSSLLDVASGHEAPLDVGAVTVR